MNTLERFGWCPYFQDQLESYTPPFSIGRIIFVCREQYRILTEKGEYEGVLAGKFRHASDEFPVVGDWVILQIDGELAVIEGILRRRSQFSRKEAGRRFSEQVVAANIDSLFLVSALNQDFNPRRIERYLVMAWESGANPVIILNKRDLCPDLVDVLTVLATVAPQVPVHALSALDGGGMDELLPYLTPGKTIAFLGSSGVGKSTLVNWLLGEKVQDVKAIRDQDGRGRHTTTGGALFPLSNGALLLDTPGMRELGLWSTEEGLGETFGEIEELAQFCKFRDCQHQNEPGCAVRRALEDGSLATERLESYRKLQKELAYQERQVDPNAQRRHQDWLKDISREIRRIEKDR